MTLVRNRLIAALPRRDRDRVLAVSETVPLTLSHELCRVGSPTRHVYFPTDGFISLVSEVDQHPGLEVGMVGREGMVGVQLLLGVSNSPLRALVQGDGAAFRVGVVAFRSLCDASASMRRQLHRYVYVLMSQTVSSVGCLRYHLVAARLARWLLMTQDRALADDFRITHEFLAYMLGVRRVGVTEAAGELQRRGLIRYHRGALTVLDRAGLEAAACSCYASDQAVYDQYMV